MKLIVTIFIISLTYQQLAADQTLEAIQQDNTGYSASIIHMNPQFPDQQAQSSIDLHFGPNNANQFGNQAKDIYSNPYPNAPLEHQSDSYPLQLTRPPKDIKPQDHPLEFVNNPLPRQFPNNKKSLSSQSFNVGYSVKFGGGQPPIPQVKQVQPTLLNPDIITGSHKEEVIKPPNINQIHEEYVLNSVLDNKKQKISGIKPKHYRPVTTNVDPAKLILQANLAPKTQMKLFELQGNKEPDYENDRYLKDANSSPWKTLSPGVEIYRSKPIQAVSNEYIEDPKRFDHVKALGKSLKFDSSNIMGFKPTNLQSTYDTQLSINTSPTRAHGNSKNLYTTDKIQQNFEIKQIETEAPTAIDASIPSDSLPYIQKHTKFSSNPTYTSQQPNIGLIQQEHNTKPNIKAIEGNYDLSKYINYANTLGNAVQHFDINIPQQKVNVQQDHRNSYITRYQNQPKNFGNPQNVPLRSNNKINTAATHSNIREVNAQLENNFNKHLANIYKFTQRNINPTIAGYGQNLKDYHSQYTHQVPVVDLTKNPMIQQYLNQPSNTARVSTQMYSVQENQDDNVTPTQLFENKIYGKNFSNSYIPHKNIYRNNYENTQKLRPISRYTKDTKRYSKPHSRSKNQARIRPFL